MASVAYPLHTPHSVSTKAARELFGSEARRSNQDLEEGALEHISRLAEAKPIAFHGVTPDLTAQKEAETVRLEERTRIARELHDTLLQTFQSASLCLGAVLYRVAEDSPVKPQLDRIFQIMRQGIAEGRDGIQGLRSSDTHASDLILALSQTMEEFEVHEETEFHVTVTGTQTQFPEQIQHEIYRIAKEALANAFHHSGAKRIELEAEYSGDGLCIRIRDNGRGMDPQVLEKGREGHWGLTAMRERAMRIGARLMILSRPNQGTELRLSIPTKTGHSGYFPTNGQHDRCHASLD